MLRTLEDLLASSKRPRVQGAMGWAQGMLWTLRDLLGSTKRQRVHVSLAQVRSAAMTVGRPAGSLSLEWGCFILGCDHKDSLGSQLDLCALVWLTRVSKGAHALYRGLVSRPLKSIGFKNPPTLLLEAYLPVRHLFPRQLNFDGEISPSLIFCRLKGVDLFAVEDISYLTINMWYERQRQQTSNVSFSINVAISADKAELCFCVYLLNMGRIMNSLTLFGWEIERRLISTYEDEEKDPQPPIQLTYIHSIMVFIIFGRMWRGKTGFMLGPSRNCRLTFKITAGYELITFVRDVIRTVYPAIAPSIPLCSSLHPADRENCETGDGGAA
jgi:hypothetical protein